MTRSLLACLLLSGCLLPVDAEQDPLLFNPPPVSSSSPWLVLLCTTSDPLITVLPPVSYFEKLFTVAGAGTGNLYDYFVDQSYGQMNLGGTVVKGWYPVNATTAALNVGSPGGRDQRIALCLQSSGIDPSRYYGIVAVYDSYTLDSGAAFTGPGPLFNSTDPKWYGQVVAGTQYVNVSFMAHEMLHGYGLSHAHDLYGDDYGDPWTIMGSGINVYYGSYGWPVPGTHYDSGPGMSAFERDKFGWLAPDRIFDWGHTSTNEQVTLTAVNTPGGGSGYLEAQARMPYGTLSVDFHLKDASWDRALPSTAVNVRRIVGGQSYLLGALYESGGGLHAGDNISDPLLQLRVDVLAIDPIAGTATVNIRSTATPVVPGPKPKHPKTTGF